MPFVTGKVIEGVFDDLRERELVEQLAEAMVRVEGEATRPVAWLVVEEIRSGDWYMGGAARTTQDVPAPAGATPAG